MSRRTDAKKARRNRRRAASDARWLPESLLDDGADNRELADVLEAFDDLVTQRGWMFGDEFSDDEAALWFYPPSLADIPGDEVTPVTTIVMFANDDAEIAHVLPVGAQDGYSFATDELIDHLDVIEAYRFGDPQPAFV